MLATLLMSACFAGPASHAVEVDLRESAPEFEARVVELFTQERCDELRAMVEAHDPHLLRPGTLAMTAYCAPSGEQAEELFGQARRGRANMETVKAVRERFQGRSTPSLFPPLALYASAQLGGSVESNPRDPDITDQSAASSPAADARVRLRAQRWYGFGSFAVDYRLAADTYSQAHAFDRVRHRLETPVSLHAGESEDIIFRPFMGFASQGGVDYELLGGLTVEGVRYRPGYKQSVAGSIYRNRLYPTALQALDGGHYRFDYRWETYPRRLYLSGEIFLEHVSAGSDVVDGSVARITRSHTDIGTSFDLQQDLGPVTLGFAPRLAVRTDSDVSNYASPATGEQIAKRRQDFIVALVPNAAFRIDARFDLFAWYEWRRIFSNLGPADYADYNYLNQTVGIALRTQVTSY
jgi:hypothetical protein